MIKENKLRLIVYSTLAILIFLGVFAGYWKYKEIEVFAEEILKQSEIDNIKLRAELIKKINEEKERKRNAFVEIYFLDVGRGDAIFINYSDQYRILVDGGHSSNKADRFLQEIMAEDEKELELVVLTHTHQDHTRGIPRVLNNFYVKRFAKNYLNLNSTISEKLSFLGLEPEIFWRGDEIKVDNIFSLEFLSPDKIKRKNNFKGYDQDGGSLVFMIDFGENKFLFTGDATSVIEQEMLESDIDVDASFLKVGHHGYYDASSEEFIEAVSPRQAIITEGGTPVAGETLIKLEKVGAETYSLEKDGFVFVRCTYYESECEVVNSKNLSDLINFYPEEEL